MTTLIKTPTEIQLLRDRLKGITFMMYRNFPFFACLLENCRIIADPTIPTANISPGGTMRISPTFAANLSDPSLCFLLAHEVSHCAFLHHTRRGTRHPRLWNISCDFAINLLVADVMGKSSLPKGGLLDDTYIQMTAEQIYESIKQGNSNDLFGAQGGLGDDLVQDVDGAPSNPNTTLRNPRAQTRPDQDPEDLWKEQVARAAANARLQHGSLSGILERLVEGLLGPKVPWHQVLRERLRHASSRPGRDDYSWTRPSRRSSGQIILPGLIEREPPTVVFAVDTSGSIGADQLKQAFSELHGVQQVTSARVYWLACDAGVHQHGWLEHGTVPPTAGGGGGTDFRPIFQHLEDKELRPDILVVVTDTAGTFPTVPPPYPVLWVVLGAHGEVPFGDTIHIDS